MNATKVYATTIKIPKYLVLPHLSGLLLSTVCLLKVLPKQGHLSTYIAV